MEEWFDVNSKLKTAVSSPPLSSLLLPLVKYWLCLLYYLDHLRPPAVSPVK